MLQKRDALCRQTKAVGWRKSAALHAPEQGEEYKITGILQGLFLLCFVFFTKGTRDLMAAEMNCLPVLFF